MSPASVRRPSPHHLVAEIIRRTMKGEAMARSDGAPAHHAPRTIQLMAASLQRTPAMILPHECKKVEGCVERYGQGRAVGQQCRIIRLDASELYRLSSPNCARPRLPPGQSG